MKQGAISKLQVVRTIGEVLKSFLMLCYVYMESQVHRIILSVRKYLLLGECTGIRKLECTYAKGGNSTLWKWNLGRLGSALLNSVAMKLSIWNILSSVA